MGRKPPKRSLGLKPPRWVSAAGICCFTCCHFWQWDSYGSAGLLADEAGYGVSKQLDLPMTKTKILRGTIAGLLALLVGCNSAAHLPDKSSKEYGDVVSAFYVGLAALQVG